MDVPYNGGDFAPGDTVQQVAPIGLSSSLAGLFYVVSANTGELELSMTLNGSPLADLAGSPRKFPSNKFRKISVAA